MLQSKEYGVHMEPRMIQRDLAAIRQGTAIKSTAQQRRVVPVVIRGTKTSERTSGKRTANEER